MTLSSLAESELRAIALEEARSADSFGMVDDVDVFGSVNSVGKPALTIVLKGSRTSDSRRYASALLDATIAIRDRLLQRGDERWPYIHFEAAG